MTDFVLVDRPDPGVAVVTLNRPERMNAMAFDVMVPFRDTLVDLGHDNSLRAIVLTGAGRGFCSGADQESAGRPPHVDGLTRPTYALRSLEMLEDVVLTIRRLHQPVIAAVNGAAIGGGLCLALACDIRVASADAYFRAAGINNGLTASELGLSYLLPRAVGASHAADIMLTGRDVGAEEAQRIGLVSRLADPVVDAAVEIGRGIGRFSQPGIELTKRSLQAGIAASSLSDHMTSEGIGQLYLRLLTDNFEEATRARREGRPAVFRDTRDPG
ncbi:MAG TPA: enoyl-CoA hydratase [Nocardioides sp.]|jgi:enoyl-CoA hydratase|uniref:enoyl-CoA hydratase n=1 Tax=Nocardioides sp. TaxID=35761 RepID=UPI002CE0E90E|nr:enoyl-CoA hydratase [Nocardioides sp.]HTW15046.1 enoyl-CoA hydratase [Nocardioides sp.]